MVLVPGLGSLVITKKLTTVKSRKINWVETLKKGKHVYYDNRHTGFYAYYLKYMPFKNFKEKFHRIKTSKKFRMKMYRKIMSGQDYI